MGWFHPPAGAFPSLDDRNGKRTRKKEYFELKLAENVCERSREGNGGSNSVALGEDISLNANDENRGSLQNATASFHTCGEQPKREEKLDKEKNEGNSLDIGRTGQAQKEYIQTLRESNKLLGDQLTMERRMNTHMKTSNDRLDEELPEVEALGTDLHGRRALCGVKRRWIDDLEKHHQMIVEKMEILDRRLKLTKKTQTVLNRVWRRSQTSSD